MGKSLYIAEKPSVAQEFAKALKLNTRRQDGYLESEDSIVTWCVGHLVTMSYPEEYDPALKNGVFRRCRLYRQDSNMKLYRRWRNSIRL